MRSAIAARTAVGLCPAARAYHGREDPGDVHRGPPQLSAGAIVVKKLQGSVQRCGLKLHREQTARYCTLAAIHAQ